VFIFIAVGHSNPKQELVNFNWLKTETIIYTNFSFIMGVNFAIGLFICLAFLLPIDIYQSVENNFPINLSSFSLMSIPEKSNWNFAHIGYSMVILSSIFILALIFQCISVRNSHSVKIPNIPENLTEEILKSLIEAKYGKESGILIKITQK
jgi:hypothetical protein